MAILTNLSFADGFLFRTLLLSLAAFTQIGLGTGHAEAQEQQSAPLELQVKAAPKWRRNETMLERLGL